MSDTNRDQGQEVSSIGALVDPEAAIQELSTQYDTLAGELARQMTTRGSRTDSEQIRRKKEIRDVMTL